VILGRHQRVLGKSQVHITPKRIIEALGPFDCDPAAADPRPWDCATRNIIEAENGLIQPWHGFAFSNPPYDRFAVARWVRRLAEHNNGSRSCTTDIATRDLNPRRSCEGEEQRQPILNPQFWFRPEATGLWCRDIRLAGRRACSAARRSNGWRGASPPRRERRKARGTDAQGRRWSRWRQPCRFSCSRCRPGTRGHRRPTEISDRGGSPLHHRLLRYMPRPSGPVVSHGCGGRADGSRLAVTPRPRRRTKRNQP
jgi:hypothetical protein